MMADDEFSSGSSDSSIDPSQFAADWNALSLKKIPVNSENPETEKNESASTDGAENHTDDAQHAIAAVAASKEASQQETIVPENKRLNKNIKIVMGESVFKWQGARRNQSSTEAKEEVSEFVTIRDNVTAPVPLKDAKIKITPPTVQLTSGDKEFTGKHASPTSLNTWVECVAIYDKQRKCHVLEVVDWTVSNLKPSSSEPDTIHPTLHPLEQQRHAEERVRKKRKQKADSARSKSPKQRPSTPKEKLPKVKYRGVTAVRRNNDIGYRSQITLEGKSRYLGIFNTPEEAARRYDQEARTKKSNVRLNFPDEAAKKTE